MAGTTRRSSSAEGLVGHPVSNHRTANPIPGGLIKQVTNPQVTGCGSVFSRVNTPLGDVKFLSYYNQRKKDDRYSPKTKQALFTAFQACFD